MLSDVEKAELLKRARHAAARALGLPEGRRDLPPAEGRLAEPGAAFVTWKKDGRLRGCIGSVEPWRPLAEDVEKNAVAALLRDPRFAPAQPRDLSRLAIDLSVMTPLEEVADPAVQREARERFVAQDRALAGDKGRPVEIAHAGIEDHSLLVAFP